MTERWTIVMVGCTDPELYGPFEDEEDRSDGVSEVVKVTDCALKLDIVDGKPVVYPFTDGEF